MNYQKIILVGNATRDAVHQKSKNGDITYTTFGMGVSDNKDRTMFFPVTVFGEHGKAIAEYITKGREILVEGRIDVSDKGYFNVVAGRVRLGAEPKKTIKKVKKTKSKKTK